MHSLLSAQSEMYLNMAYSQHLCKVMGPKCLSFMHLIV